MCKGRLNHPDGFEAGRECCEHRDSCTLGQSDCDGDAGCIAPYVCGVNNCDQFLTNPDWKDDCCTTREQKREDCRKHRWVGRDSLRCGIRRPRGRNWNIIASNNADDGSKEDNGNGGQKGCSDDSGCSPSMPNCDVKERECFYCQNDGHCSVHKNKMCGSDGRCIKRQTGQGCSDDSDCSHYIPNCDVKDGECFYCQNDGHCSVHRNKICGSNGKCIQHQGQAFHDYIGHRGWLCSILSSFWLRKQPQ